MQENTNKAILFNSFVLYIRLGIIAICGLATTRFALQALGIDDFGLFSVIGGIISFISIINTIMAGTSNRFIATAIGKNNLNLINTTFNVNLIIHIFIAVLIVIIAFPLGSLYIHNCVQYTGNIEKVVSIFNITIIGSIISIIGVPCNGLLLARERFVLFSVVEIFAAIIKLIVARVLIYHFDEKLLIYASVLSFLSAFPTLVYWIYCKKIFPEIVKFKVVKEWNAYKSVLSFSVWVGYGALATIAKSQGSALIVNAFFNTIMNTALGLANTVNGVLMMFSNSVTKSISPQITKSYASGNYIRSENLVILASKTSFLIMFMFSIPFFVAPEFIFNLWLGKVPNYVTIFTYLIIIDALIGTLNAGIPHLIFAMGNIKWYQIIVNTTFLLSIIVGFFVLKAGAPAYYLIITYIVFSIIVFFIRQIILKRLVKINSWRLIKESYLRSLLITACFFPLYFTLGNLHPIIKIVLSYAYLIPLVYYLGLNRKERNEIINVIKSKIK